MSMTLLTCLVWIHVLVKSFLTLVVHRHRNLRETNNKTRLSIEWDVGMYVECNVMII